MEIPARLGAALGQRQWRDLTAGSAALCGRGVREGPCGIEADSGGGLGGVFWAEAGRGAARKRVRQHPDGEVYAESLRATRPALLRLATLASTPRAGRSVSDVVITFVSYVLIRFTVAPYPM